MHVPDAAAGLEQTQRIEVFSRNKDTWSKRKKTDWAVRLGQDHVLNRQGSIAHLNGVTKPQAQTIQECRRHDGLAGCQHLMK